MSSLTERTDKRSVPMRFVARTSAAVTICIAASFGLSCSKEQNKADNQVEPTKTAQTNSQPLESPTPTLTRQIEGTPTSEVSSETNKAPDYVLKDLSGNEVYLRDLYGEPLVLGLWMAFGEPSYQEALKVFEEIGPDFQGENIKFLAIAVGASGPEVPEYLKENGEPRQSTVLIDPSQTSDLARELGVDFLPAYVVIDQKGRIVRIIDQKIKNSQLSAIIQQVFVKN